MFRYLNIKNLALIKEAEVEFRDGFNAVTGETGAGKSVMMSGLKLLLGGRFEKNSIRRGAERCEVTGEFAPSAATLEKIAPVLENAGVQPCEDGVLQIRRVFTAASGRIFVNSSPAGAKLLAELGEYLVDIHNADDSHGLMKSSEQLAALDRFAGCAREKDLCRAAWDALRDVREKTAAFDLTMPSADEAVRLRADIDAIMKVGPHEGEDAELFARHSAAANSKEVMETSSAAVNALCEGEDSITDRVSTVKRLVQSLERSNPEFVEKFAPRCEEIYDMLRALSDDIADAAASVDLDAGAFAALEERMSAIQAVKRKYGPSLADVLANLEKYSGRLSMFENSAFEREKLAEKEKFCEKELAGACGKLSEKRKKNAEKLSALLTKEIIKLGFKHSDFGIDFSEAPPSANGADRIEFMFSPNPGSPRTPLRNTASSGELSRVMLAVRTVLAEADEIPTLVFDEIDANIGGETAVTVADELAALAKKKQIISISHLPQVAAKADCHLTVEKKTSKDSAVSVITEITGKARVAELARMLGGGKAALDHASKLF